MEAQEVEKIEKIEARKLEVIERHKREPKPFHIKQSERCILQLYKNLYVFYDKKLEYSVPQGQTMLQYIKHKIVNENGFQAMRLSKFTKEFITQVQHIKDDGPKKHSHKTMT